MQAGEEGDRSELRRNWRLLLTCTMGIGLGFPTLCFYSIGIFAPVFAAEFGWKLSTILAGLAIAPVVLMLFGPVVGAAVDRYGSRPVAMVSHGLLGLCVMALAFSNGSTALWYTTWTAIALAGCGATSMTFTRAINTHFDAQRGLAIGIALAGTGLFAFLIKPLAAVAIAELGWRGALIALGLLPIVISVPLDAWGIPAGRSNTVPHARALQTGAGLRAALTSRSFLTLALAFFATAFALGAPLPNMESILKARAFDPLDIVALTATIGIASIAGRLMGGWLVDRLNAVLVGAAVIGASAIGCWLLAMPGASFAGALVAILLMGFAGGVEIDLAAYLVARLVGTRHYGAIYGLMFGLLSIASGAGPALIGYLFDRSGSFGWILQICAGLLVGAALLLLTLDRRPFAHSRTGRGRTETKEAHA